jgi:hypothetical protein
MNAALDQKETAPCCVRRKNMYKTKEREGSSDDTKGRTNACFSLNEIWHVPRMMPM